MQEPPTLPRLQYCLNDMGSILMALHQFVYTLEASVRKPGGCDALGPKLIEELMQQARCGHPALQSCYQRLLWHCNQVLLKQLSTW